MRVVLVAWLLVGIATVAQAQQETGLTHLLKVGSFPLEEYGGSHWVTAASSQKKLYAFNETGLALCVDTLGQVVRKASQPRWLNPSHLHAQSGPRVFLFSQDGQQAFWIDRLLGQDQPLVFNEHTGFYAAMCPSVAGGFWGIELHYLELHHLGYNGEITQTIPLQGAVSQEAELAVAQIVEAHGKVYALLEKQGLLVWSNTGSFLGKVLGAQPDGMSISSGQLFVWTQNKIFRVAMNNELELLLDCTKEGVKVKNLSISYPYLFNFQNKDVTIYRLE